MRVLVVDDSEAVRLGLRALLDAQPDLECCGTASDGRQGIELARTSCPDVVLMDLGMPDIDGVEASRCILRDQPRTCVLILTATTALLAREAAVLAGAAGYVSKQLGPAPLLAAIRATGEDHHDAP